MSNSTQFLQAAEAVNQLSTKPDNTTLGKLYGLYKQATVGDNNTNKPGILDVKGKCVLNIVPKNTKIKSFIIDKQCKIKRKKSKV